MALSVEENQIDTLANRPIQREENPNQASDGKRTKPALLSSARNPEQHMKRPCSETTRVAPRARHSHSIDISTGERPSRRSAEMHLAPPTGPRSAT